MPESVALEIARRVSEFSWSWRTGYRCKQGHFIDTGKIDILKLAEIIKQEADKEIQNGMGTKK